MRYFQNLILTQFLLDLQRGRFHDALAMVLLGGIEVSQYTYDEFPEYRAFVDGHVCPVCLDGGDDLPPGQYLDWRVARCNHVFCQPCAARLMVREGRALPRCPTCRQVLRFYFA